SEQRPSPPLPSRRRHPLSGRSNTAGLQKCLADSLRQIVWTASSDGKSLSWNRYWTEYTGLSGALSRGNAWQRALHPEDAKQAGIWWRQAVCGGAEADVRIRIRRTSDGAYRWHLCRAMPVRNEAGEVVAWMGTAIDMHDQAETEERLKSSESWYRDVVEMSQDAIYVWSEGKFVFGNQATARIFGASSLEELIGKTVLQFFDPADHEIIRARAKILFEQRRPLPPLETRLMRLDGRIIDVESVATPFLYRGKPSAHVIIRDITERKILFEQE